MLDTDIKYITGDEVFVEFKQKKTIARYPIVSIGKMYITLRLNNRSIKFSRGGSNIRVYA